MNNDLGIYIHIPFCLKKCYYCDFVSFMGKEDMIEKYIYALCTEIIQNADILSEHVIDTIYIGGGTPSYIDAKYIKQILDTLYLVIDKNNLKEVTIECNPNSITKEKMDVYKECGINRVSIGLQSTHDDVLKTIGRVHTFKDFENAIDIVNSCGINNISVDLIYPLPNLDFKRFKESVDYVISLKYKNVKHISIYSLEVHENTKLDFILKEGYASLVDEDEEYEMYEYLRNTLEKNGFHRYEISNYAITGYESMHNTRYWNQKEYLGFGVNASSFLNSSRYKNIPNLEKYIESINTNVATKTEVEDLDLLSLMKEYIILSLRKIDGLNLQSFKSKYKKDVFDLFKIEIDELIKNGLLILDRDANSLKLSQRGLEVANIVWEAFV